MTAGELAPKLGDYHRPVKPDHANNSGSETEDELVNADGYLSKSYRYDYAGRCWWCGQTADSGEHKYKRTDLVRAFGGGPWRDQTAVVQVVGEHQRDLQSPGSQRLKFSKVFCGDCNSKRSQRFDLAYERFSNHVISNQERIWSVGGFRWSHIFDDDWRSGRNLVTAYWLKHIGCRLADGGVEVDERIIRFLNNPGEIKQTPLRLELQIREDIVELTKHSLSHGERFESLWISDLMCLYSRSRGIIHQATGHWGLSWLHLVYQFDLNYSRAVANFWRDKVRLARHSSVDPNAVIQNCTDCATARVK